MDFSVVAAIGSFAISERVLKPKATALFILGCVLAYDLTTKTHDVTALRVYRGPALLAFTLMMSAYSLRTWRRNGVACDELLFLPGTLHGHEHGVEGPLIEMPPAPPPPPPPLLQQSPTPSSATSSPALPSKSREVDRSVGQGNNNNVSNNANSITAAIKNSGVSAGSGTAVASGNGYKVSPDTMRRRRTISDEFDATITEKNISAEIPIIPTINSEEEGAGVNESEALLGEEEGQSEKSWNIDEDDIEETPALVHRNTGDLSQTNDDRMDNSGTRVQRWRENHPRLARLGTFFFFRSTTTSTQNAAYAPSGPSVFGAALDLSMPVLFNFHLFIEAFNHIDSPTASDAPAKMLPVIFLSVLIVRTVIPPGRRFRFWGTLKFSFTAPLHKVKFRDEFIGEVMTSWVRPGQDLFFALSYYLTVIYGTVSGKYGLTRSGEILEESWLLHNVILPSFAILPLWLKYLQTLRQAYDTNKRWPYQANSFKYLTSTLVIIYGIAHPDQRKSPWWVFSFFLVLLYQIAWDVIIDWELFEIQRDIQLVDAEPDTWCNRISSFRPNSHFLLKIQMYMIQPILDFYQRQRASLPGWGQIQLRSKRLYKTENFYWKIFFSNCIMRFTWMLCFIPAYHVSRSRTVLTSTSDVDSYWGVLLPSAEIVRRTLWGFLFLERETIKLMDSDSKYSRVAPTEEEDDEEDDDSKFGVRSFRTQLLPTWLDKQQQVAHSAATSGAKQRDHFMRQLFIFELYGWAAAFVILGCWAAS